MSVRDAFGRPLRSLRLSVTDRCNIRCSYCMPDENYVWLQRSDLLTFEEMVRLVGVFTRAGVTRVRLTGGEPLLRRHLPDLVAQLAMNRAIHDLAMTTNGVLLAGHAASLRQAGLHRITVSLDTLKRDRFTRLTRFDKLDSVLAGIEAARGAFGGLKIDTVLIRGVNDDEIVDLVEFGKRASAEVRFIEYMDVGGATRWSWDQVVTRQEVLDVLDRRYGPPTPIVEDSCAPADRYALADGTVVGIISSTTQPFCHDCDRARVTADGHWFHCLYAETGVDLRAAVRGGASDDQVEALLRRAWEQRRDRGAEARLTTLSRRAHTARVDQAHQQMHTRGG